MLIAQGLGEYGAMSGLSAGVQSAVYHVEAFISDLGTKEYVVIAAVAVVLYMLFGKRR